VAERKWLLRRDGDLYFPETLVPRRLEKDYAIAIPSDAAGIALNGGKALTALLRTTDDLHITRPTPYYAMIQMDGDKMGILLSDVKDQAEHMEISKALSTFSRKSAPEMVEDNYPGRLIYAGGDDVFALAPLARDAHVNDEPLTVLDLVDRLQRIYRTTVQEPVSDNERKESVTTSAGIAIAHHYTPLSYVRRVVKASEELAKDHYGRNALVVTVIRRSGEQTRVGCHWYYDKTLENGEKQHIEPISLFSRFYELFKNDVLSSKCIHILLEEAVALVGLEEKAQQSEIRRVLQRQYDKNMVSELKSEDELAKLAERLVDLAETMDRDQRNAEDKKQHLVVELHSNERRYGLIEVLGWLLVMAFLTRKEQE
jgi:CRISPR-associated protein Cmr2